MITQELIFIIILAVFIGGMLWSDRDSRRLRWYERDGTAEALLSLSKVGISAAKAAENLRRNIIMLSTPSGRINPILIGTLDDIYDMSDVKVIEVDANCKLYKPVLCVPINPESEES